MDHPRENAWLSHQQARWLRPDAYDLDGVQRRRSAR